MSRQTALAVKSNNDMILIVVRSVKGFDEAAKLLEVGERSHPYMGRGLKS